MTNEWKGRESTASQAFATARALEDFVDQLGLGYFDNEDLRNRAHQLRFDIQNWAARLLTGDVKVSVSAVGATFPERLCGAEDDHMEKCVLTPHEGQHSWQKESAS